MTWYKIFDSVKDARKQLPVNEAVRVVINDVEICLAHTRQGFFAVQDSCTHLGDSLSRGTMNYLNEIVCPWHAYRFNLRTGEETTGHGCRDLKVYSVELRDDGLFIGI